MNRIPSRWTGQRVLLVEDHPGNAATLGWLFRRNGCRVSTATCAADALVMASLEPFDFVVINREMVQGSSLSEHFVTRGGMRRQDVFAYAMNATQAA